MIHSLEDVQVPRPANQEAFDEIAIEEDGEHGFLELGGRLGHIGEHIYVFMSTDVVL